MPQEVIALAAAGLLKIVHFWCLVITANRQVGTDKTMGPRDVPIELTGKVGRLQRALDNYYEGLIFFTLAVVVISFGGFSSPLTVVLSWVFVATRILYVPAYIWGWVPGRSLIWAVGWIASAIMIIYGFLGAAGLLA